ncbi:hypothetical protein SDC9_211302 [bioreactor metagenome]|uniref:Uncharacterized protein n=1 Tax=bioreactor metagenome TaxID=1076179 RepID=A0A645JIN4_9ZZZZ
MELVGHGGQQEVHGAQAQNGEDIAGQHDERVAGHGEDRRDGVHRENHVRQRDQADHHEQGGGDARAVLHGPEFFAVVVVAHVHDAAQQAQRGVAVQARLLTGGPPHLHAGQD